MKSIIKLSIILMAATVIMLYLNNEGPSGPLKDANNLFLGMVFISLILGTTISLITLKNKKS